MDTLTIEQYLHQLKIPAKVLAMDEFLNVENRSDSGFYIVNNEPSTMDGLHWMAIVLSDSFQPNEFFDSFGENPNFYNQKMADILGSNCIYNNKILQSDYSNICGLYCIYYLFKHKNDMSMSNITSVFSSNVVYNDNLVVRWSEMCLL